MNKAVFDSVVLSDIVLFDFLKDNLSESKNNIKSIISNNSVYVNGNVVNKANFLLKSNDNVVVYLHQIKYKNYIIDILYEDEYFVCINKPNGMLSVSTMNSSVTAYSIVRDYINKKKQKLFILHRLDRDTSGILLFCKDVKIRDYMQNNWDELVLRRGYLAVTNKITNKSGCIKSYLYEDSNYNVKSTSDSRRGKLAITNYSVISSNKKYSLLQLFLETGRKNQIRVHMQSIGKSILGDKKYGGDKSDRLYLHSNILEFVHPVYNKNIILNSFCDFKKHF